MLSSIYYRRILLLLFIIQISLLLVIIKDRSFRDNNSSTRGRIAVSALPKSIPKLENILRTTEIIGDMKIPIFPCLIIYMSPKCNRCEQECFHLQTIASHTFQKKWRVITLLESSSTDNSRMLIPCPIGFGTFEDRGGKVKRALKIVSTPYVALVDKQGGLIAQGYDSVHTILGDNK